MSAWTVSGETFVRSRRVVLPDGVRSAALAIKSGRFTRVEEYDAVPEGAPRLEFGDLTLLAGIVDTHVHINEPGRTEWEGFETATSAAAAGGITTLVDMPLNSIPPATSARGVAEKAAATEGRLQVDVGLWGGAVPENTTGDKRGLAHILEEGAHGFKCFMLPSGVLEFPFVTLDNIEDGLAQLRDRGVRFMVHAEMEGPIDAVAAEVAKQDPRRYATYLASRPPSAEEEAIRTLFGLAERTRVPIHVVHLSSQAGLKWLARARDEGVPLTAETAPHYLHFAAEQIPDGATWFKCAPPIREAANREALWEAVRSGLIEMIVSDHSPCIPELKRVPEGDFMSAWGGIAGLQFSFLAMFTEARRRGFDIRDVSRWMSEKPAEHAGLAARKGRLAVGLDADFTVLDEAGETVVTVPEIRHKNKLTPYDGETLNGRVLATFVRGECVYACPDAAKTFLLSEAARAGRWIKRS